MPNYTLYYFNGRGRAEICRMMFAAAGVKYTDKRIEFKEWDRCRKDFPCNYLPCLEMDGGMRMPETMAICRYIARQYGYYPKSSMDMMRCDYISDCFYEIMHDYMRCFHWKNGRFRYDFMDGGMMGGNMSSGMMGGNMSSGMMGGNMSSGMMGGNMSSGMMRGNMTSGMMGGNMMSPDSSVSSSMSSCMGGSDRMNCNYDNYMQWRWMNSFNRIMPFMERTLCMRDGGSKFFMGNSMMWCDMMMYCCLENMYMQNQSMFTSYPKMMACYKRVSSHPKICSYLKSRCMTNW